MNDEVLIDVGGELAYDCQTGRPSSASVTLHDPGGSQLASPSVTIDTANTTIASTYVAGSVEITVAAATGVDAGRRYLLDNGENEPEWVHVKAVDGTTVTLHGPTGYTHDTSSTFVGTRITATVTASVADTLHEGCEARWVYVVGSQTHRPVAQFDIVRSVWPAVILLPFEFSRFAGQMAQERNESTIGAGLDFSEDIALATEDVRRDILSRGYRPALFRSHSEFKRPIAERVLYRWARHGDLLPSVWQDDPAGWVEMRQETYTEALVEALNTTRSYDADESGVVTEVERKRKLGVIRLTR